MWRLRVLHATGYAYRSPVTASYNEARLTPRSDARQNVIINRVETAPATRSYQYLDYWGTAVTAFDLHAPHLELEVTSSSVVETDTPEPARIDAAWADLAAYSPGPLDSLVGLAASGTTPYVLGGVQAARRHGLLTGCITCNAGTPLAAAVACPVEAIVGPEFVTGSTRMKAGTAQKLLLNMLSTSVMIQLGRVKGNRMVDMKLSNDKLVSRGIRMVAEELGLAPAEAAALLERHGSVRAAVSSHSR